MPAPSSGLTQSLLGTANGLVAYAQNRMAAVDGFVTNLSSMVLSLQAPTITPVFPEGASSPAISVPSMPTLEAPVWVAPGFPQPLIKTLETGDLQVAPFDDNPPEIVYGTAPAPFTGQMPEAPPVDLQFDLPDLKVDLPAAPDLLALNTYSFSPREVPTFDADEPQLLAVEPMIREYVPGKQYTSALLERLKSTLEEQVRNGTPLSSEVENAIWDRGREREARSAREALDQIEKMEALGYSFMPGVYLDARLKVITETDANSRGHSREAMIKSAELALDGVKHALSTAVQLEGSLIDYTNAVETRVFEAARFATQAQVEIYNAKVTAYGRMVDMYRAKVAVYEAVVRAEQQRVETYRAQIAAEEAKANINRALVDMYRVQTDVSLANIEIYKARIGGIQAKAEIEKAKVQVFGAQVQGYSAQINAYTANVEGFRATLQAEATKQDVYRASVDGFRARVDAYAKQIDARVSEYQGLIAAKTAEYQGYQAAVAGESARVDAIVKNSGVRADAFRAQVQSISSYNDVLVKQWQATLDQNQQTARIGIEAARANAEMYVTTRSLALDAAKTGAQVAAQIGAAAINAVNFSGSVSSSEGYTASESQSWSTSTSQSNANSNSTNYNYNASV